MSILLQGRGEAGGGVAAHLQCPLCGHFSKSHAHQLSHIAASHPCRLDDVVVGRLGNILLYQSTARLFHCSDCFFTSRDFGKLYKHLISRHCEDGSEDEKDGAKRPRSGEGRDEGRGEGRGEGRDEEPAPQRPVAVKTEGGGGGGGGEEKPLMFRCLICGWKSKMKSVGVHHVVRKHDIPKSCASRALKQDATGPEDEDDNGDGLSGEMLKEEAEATARVVRFISNRWVCLTCGWKSKLKGFAVSHVVRCHDVERPYRCKDCARCFFLPSRLQQHVRSDHRPGRYACPFCCFRSHFLGGFRRHCSRCNAREGREGEGEAGGGGGGWGGGGGGGGGGEGEEEDENQEEEGEEKRGGRPRRRRRRKEKVIKEEDDDD